MQWLDKMVNKLKAELERQLNAVTDLKINGPDGRLLAANARTLVSLERTLERLSKLECERAAQKAAVREKKVAKYDQGARVTLQRRLDKLAAAKGPKGGAGGS